jgi:hypothetical protein
MTEVKGLIISLEARTAQLERGLKRANDAQRRAANQMERRAQQSARRIENSYARAANGIASSFSRTALAFGGGLAGGILGGTSIAAISANAQRAIADMSNLAKTADRIDFNVEALQGLQRGFELAGTSADTLNSSLERFTRRIGEARNGQGAFLDVARRYNIELNDQNGQARTQEQILNDVADVIARTTDQAERLTIVNAAFGQSGASLVNALAGGSAALREMISEAREAGHVLDESLLRKAEVLDDKMFLLRQSAKVTFRQMVIGAAEFTGAVQSLESIFGNLDRARSQLGDDLYNVLEKDIAAVNKYANDLQELAVAQAQVGYALQDARPELDLFVIGLERVGEIGASEVLRNLINEAEEIETAFRNGTISAEDYRAKVLAITERMEALIRTMESANAIGFDGAVSRIDFLSGAIQNAAAWARRLVDNLSEAAGVNVTVPDETGSGIAIRRPDRNTVRPRAKPIDIDWGMPPEPRNAGRSGGGGGGAARENELERLLRQTQERTRLLELEAIALAATAGANADYASAIETARKEAELLAAAERAGIALTPELRAKISEMSAGYAQAGEDARKTREEIERAAQAQAELGDTARSAFVGMLTRAHDFHGALNMIIQKLIEMAANKAITTIFGGGAGGILGGIGKIFGFAEGGYTGDGGKYEPAGIVHKGEYVFSKQTVQRLGADNLERLHISAKKGYASGGLVGAAGKAVMAASGPSTASRGASAPVISINAPVTVNATGGTPEANADLAAKVAEQTERAFRGMIQQELVRQMRPGGMLR